MRNEIVLVIVGASLIACRRYASNLRRHAGSLLRTNALAVTLLLAACSAPPMRDGSTIEEVDLTEPQQDSIAMPQRQLEGAGSSAVDQLLEQANAAIAEQRYERAAALIERAMRVSPYDARAYFALAQVNFHQRRLALSESLLQKARALAVNDTPLLRSIDAFSKRLAGIQ